jgi:hypothetical protein
MQGVFRRGIVVPVAVMLVLVACQAQPSGGATPGAAHTPGLTTSAASESPTLPATPRPPGIRHVIVVLLENEEYGGVTSSSMPYLTGLAATYGLSTRYDAVAHPSLPNYLALWAGSTFGVNDDRVYNLSARSISNQMTAAGLSWRAYMQNYPATPGCHRGAAYADGVDGWGVAGTYARKHDPAMSFTSVSTTGECANVRPLAAFDPLVNFAFVAPNLCNDGHDCGLRTADAFLRVFLPHAFRSPDWAHTLLVVTFDEGSTSSGGGGHVFTMVARAGLGHVVSSRPHDHYGLLRTIQAIFGLPCLRNSCSANPMSEFLP